ncbi:MAG: hypothetical protein GWP10_19510 [Nitrospiraceae bacterium]|nr:hypothetical protein [Nitrospiraceae bacterium]
MSSAINEQERHEDLIEDEDDYSWMEDHPFFNEELDDYLESTACCSIRNIAARTGQLDPFVSEHADAVVYTNTDGRELFKVVCINDESGVC